MFIYTYIFLRFWYRNKQEPVFIILGPRDFSQRVFSPGPIIAFRSVKKPWRQALKTMAPRGINIEDNA